MKITIKEAALMLAVSTSLAGCDALQITGGPLDIGAAQADNLLNHGGFERGFGAWRACSDPTLVSLQTNDTKTEGAAKIDAGGCLYQTVPAQENDNMVLNCSALKTSNNWASITFGYLDKDFQPLKSVEAPIPSSDYTNVSTSLRAPENTAHIEVLIYAQDGAVVDNCELVNTQQGAPTEYLSNSYFEEDMNGWQVCSKGTATAENGVATITDSCVSQKFTASEGLELMLTCDGIKSGDKHAAVALGFLDENFQAIEMTETPISFEEDLYPTVLLTAPAATAYAQAMVYTEGEVTLNSCSLQQPAAE